MTTRLPRAAWGSRSRGMSPPCRAAVSRRQSPRAKRAARAAQEERPHVFAAGCGFYKLACLFFLGSFLGDVTETIFCRLTTGVWMSRSSVVYGPFSLVWGFGAVLLAQKKANRKSQFAFGPFLCIGIAIAMFFGETIADWYMGLL